MSDEGWQRVHPLSPLLRMWAALVGVAAVILFQQAETLRWAWDRIEDSPLPGVVAIPAVLVVLVAVFLLAFVLVVVATPREWFWAYAGFLAVVAGDPVAGR